MELNTADDTIAAIATPRGTGGIAVIRVSGPSAHELASRVFRPKRARRDMPPYTAVYGDFYAEGKAVDAGLATFFYAPRSYTGEDMAELSCHGGVFLSNLILRALLDEGARLAQAGEFTRRAFLNGKLSLTEVEATGALIGALTAGGARLAAAQAAGALSRRLDALAEELTYLISQIYAGIDYPDEELGELGNAALLERIGSLSGALASLAASFGAGKIISQGADCAIIGKANTGKSTLYNLLARRELAIVTASPGTTRDALETTVTLGEAILRLRDTAGLRETSDDAERLGIARSLEVAAETELLLCLFDGSSPLDGDDARVIEAARAARERGAQVAAVINKRDLPPALDEGKLLAELGFDAPVICVSARENASEVEGVSALEAMERLLIRLYGISEESIDSGEILASERQYAVVVGAASALARAEAALSEGFPQNIAGLDMEAALAALRECDARGAAGEVTEAIFRNFCVGK